MPNQDQGADTPPVATDAGAEGATEQAQTEQSGEAAGVAASEQKLVFGKYTSMEEAEKAWKESERTLHAKAQEAADARREMESLRGQADLKSLLGEIVKAKQAESKPAVNFDAFIEETSSTLLEDPKTALRKLTSALSSWQKQDHDDLAAKIVGLETIIRDQQKSVEDRVEKADPFYEKHRATLDELTSGGMNMKAAKTFVRKAVEAAGEDTRDAAPPSLAARRTQPPDEATVKYFDTPDERVDAVRRFGEEVVKQMESEWVQKIRAEAVKGRK